MALAVAVAGVAVALTLNKRAAQTRVIVRQTAHAPATGAVPPSGDPAATIDASASGVDVQRDPAAVYEGASYSLTPPAGWHLDSREVDHGSYIESRWHLPGEPHVVLLIDHTAGYTGSALEGAESVRRASELSAGYRLVAWHRIALEGGEGWQWRFDIAGERKVDTFLVACGTGYAILGEAPTSSFSTFRRLFDQTTRSLRPAC